MGWESGSEGVREGWYGGRVREKIQHVKLMCVCVYVREREREREKERGDGWGAGGEGEH